MLKFLKGVAAGSGTDLRDLPYNVGEPYSSAWGSWVHFGGTSKVRHPNILSFLHSTEAEIFDGSTTKVTIYTVTEPVMPLSEKIKELGLKGSQRDEYFAWGLHRIAKAVSFLNNDCKLVHVNVCMASVVVTDTLDWKLHAFDVLLSLMGTVKLLLGKCCNMSGLLVHNTNQWSYKNLIGRRSESLHLVLLIRGAGF